MESKYDRVEVPENLYLHEHEQDDFGTGVYPISVISRKSNMKDDTVKVACFKMRRKSRLLFFCVALISFLVLTLIIVIASKHNSESPPAMPTLNKEHKTKGISLIRVRPSIHYNFLIMCERNRFTHTKLAHLITFRH